MAGSVESRLQALERARALPLPLYLLTFTDGSSRFMDALGVLLYLARLDAGAEDKPIRAAERVRGQLPAGTAWRTLESELADHVQK